MMGSNNMKSVRIGELTWTEIRKAMENGYKTVIFAIGSTEQHGPGLPEYTDTLQGDFIAHKLALRFRKTLVAPAINVGCSEHHLAFPGTISLRKETLKAVVEDYADSLVHHGFNRIILIPFHGGNFAPTAEIVAHLEHKYPAVQFISHENLIEFLGQFQKAALEEGYTIEEARGHADVWESSNMLFLDEDHVFPEFFEVGYTGEIGKKELDCMFLKGIEALTSNGILGDSRRANKESGRRFLEKIEEYLFNKIAFEMGKLESDSSR
jgi:creatinine amidohydrolase